MEDVDCKILFERRLYRSRKCRKNSEHDADMICQVEATLTAYADPDPTLAMMVMMTCSLMVKGPGLSWMPKRETFGR